MSKFKVGDDLVMRPGAEHVCVSYRSKLSSNPGAYMKLIQYEGSHLKYSIHNVEGKKIAWCFGCITEDDVQLMNKGDNNVNEVKQRRTFKLIKNTPTHKAGTLFQEMCDDGTQPYAALIENPGIRSDYQISDRSLVEDQPKWFVEVFQVEPQYMTQDELDAFAAFKASRSKRAVKKAAAVPKKRGGYQWTPAQRKAQAARSKAYWAAKKAA